MNKLDELIGEIDQGLALNNILITSTANQINAYKNITTGSVRYVELARLSLLGQFFQLSSKLIDY